MLTKWTGCGPAVVATGSVVDGTIEAGKTPFKVEPTILATQQCCSSLKPAIQPPYKPRSTPTIQVSRANIRDQIDVGHLMPTQNTLGFADGSGGWDSGLGGSADDLYWVYEWSTDATFKGVQSYEARAIADKDTGCRRRICRAVPLAVTARRATCRLAPRCRRWRSNPPRTRR